MSDYRCGQPYAVLLLCAVLFVASVTVALLMEAP